MGDQSNTEQKFTRRKFLKTAALGAAAAALSLIPPGEKQKQPNPEKNSVVPKILQPDIFLPSDKKLNATTLTETVVSNEEEAKTLLIQAFTKRYENHGELTNEVRENAANEFNVSKDKVQTDHATITEALSVRSTTFDEFGNPHVILFVDPQKIENIIQFSDAQIISMSFELGELKATYEQYGSRLKYPDAPNPRRFGFTINSGKPDEKTTYSYEDANGNKISEERFNEMDAKANEREVRLLPSEERDFYFADGYAEETAYGNLSLLATLAKKYPKKIFLAAAGNPFKPSGSKHWQTPNIREAKDQLKNEEKWPENLIIVGVEGAESGYLGPFSNGADIYINYKNLFTSNQGSSFATPIVAEVVRRIMASGVVEPGRVKDTLFNLTNETQGENPYHVLSFAKVGQFIGKPPFKEN